MTREQASNILAEYVKACREDDMLKLEEFSYEEVITAMDMGAKALEQSNSLSAQMKTEAIVYEQHQEVARIPIDKIEYIYALVDGIRVSTSIPNGWGYESYEGDEIEFV